MKITSKAQVVITLTLSEDEAEWLKTLVQNPPKGEPGLHAIYRCQLLEALAKELDPEERQ